MRTAGDTDLGTARGMRTSTRAALLAGLSIITPAGLVLVNVAAYVMSNLVAFRLAITISAVLSTFLLNGLTAVAGYRLGVREWPDFWLFRADYRRAVFAEFLFLLSLGTALAGRLTYAGLSDPRQLPNLSTFVAGLIGLAVPIALAAAFRQEVTPRARRRYRTR